MFYRFVSKLATQERLEAFPVPRQNSDTSERWGVGWIHFERKFKPAPAAFNQPGVKFFHAPSIADRPIGICLRFHQGKESETLPDLWGVGGKLFISQGARAIVESFDDLAHEYFPVHLIDYQEQPFTSDQSYYWFCQRRHLTIAPSNRTATATELGFHPVPHGEDFMARVKDNSILRECLGKLPLWQHCAEDIDKRSVKERSILYMSQVLINAFQEADLSGLELYSEKYGVGEESVCVV
ncbi:hypothetical protein [Hahella ganghwensis]|uniref:hypothetical protein n=1 Tax=Hahella ganghwensis TaxID=286420 RepID=UPI00037311F6|nr:hypothetical protein [Hahella ganghwensis]